MVLSSYWIRTGNAGHSFLKIRLGVGHLIFANFKITSHCIVKIPMNFFW